MKNQGARFYVRKILLKFNMELHEWQRKFIDEYTSSNAQKSRLVAATDTGKTITTLNATKNKIATGNASSFVVISDKKVLREQ